MNIDKLHAKLTTTDVYGIYHTGISDGVPLMDTDLIYVGGTRDPLERRMDYHRNQARQGNGSPIYEYIRDVVEKPLDDLTIEEIPYESEADALSALRRNTLNATAATGGDYYSWTTHEVRALVNTIKEKNLHAAQQKLCANATQIRNAAVRLGFKEVRDFTHIDWDEWDDLLGTMSDQDLAAKIGCSEAAVYQRRQKLGVDAYHAPLDKDEVLKAWIAHHLDPSQTRKEVAQRVDFEVTGGQVGCIIREDTFEDVDKPSPAEIQTAETYEAAREAYLDGQDCLRSKPSSSIDGMRGQQ